MKKIKSYFTNWMAIFKEELHKASEIQNRIDERRREEEMKYKIMFYGHH